MRSKAKIKSKLIRRILIIGGVIFCLYIFLEGPVIAAIINSDPVKTKANVLYVRSDFSRSGVFSDRRTSYGQYNFVGAVEIEYSYEFEGNIFVFE